MYNYIAKATENLTLDELSVFAVEFKKRRKKKRFAYLWWLLFAFGGHRFYLGFHWSGLVMAFLTIFTLGLGAIVGLLDVVNINRLHFRSNKELVLQIVKEVKKVE